MKLCAAHLPVILILAATSPVAAQSSYGEIRRNLKHHFKADQFRIFYDTEGIHAVDAADENGNGVPDQVEDVAKQTWAAHKVFVEALGFPDPLKSERYSRAAFVDVNLLAKKTLGSNGVAYDAYQRFRRPIDSDETLVLSFDVATSVKAHSNGTPAHEYFHLIQNGATFFKTRWYTEGMARWSEFGLGDGGVRKIEYGLGGPWPQTDALLTRLFNESYGASTILWTPLAKRVDRRGLIPSKAVSPVVQRLTYSNGEKVLKDFVLNGWEFMREILLELGKMDDVAYRELGYSKWSEDNQKSKENSRFIYQAVMDVARRHRIRVGPFSAIRP